MDNVLVTQNPSTTVPSPSDTVESVIRQVREKLEASHSYPMKLGEQNTKNGAIEPVLRSLGWDTENFEEVFLEYKPRSGGNPVDYALMWKGEPKLFVEAKGYEVNIDDIKLVEQCLWYTTSAGVRWIILTNGWSWKLYDAHSTAPAEGKLCKETTIADSDAVTDFFAQLTKDNVIRGKLDEMVDAEKTNALVKVALEELFNENPPPQRLIGLVEKTILNSSQPGEQPISREHIKKALSQCQAQFHFPPHSAAEEPKRSEAGLVEQPQGSTVAKGGKGNRATRMEGLGDGRARWEEISSHQSMKIIEDMLEIINAIHGPRELKYNKRYIGLFNGDVVDNFTIFRPRSNGQVLWEVHVPRSEQIERIIESSTLHFKDYNERWGNYRFYLDEDSALSNRENITNILRIAGTYSSNNDQGLSISGRNDKPIKIYSSAAPVLEEAPPLRKSKYYGVKLVDVIAAGVLPTGTTLVATEGKYKHLTAQVVEGGILFRGETYPSPSTAGTAARRTIEPDVSGPNGWVFWAEQSTGKKLSSYREEYRQQSL